MRAPRFSVLTTNRSRRKTLDPYILTHAQGFGRVKLSEEALLWVPTIIFTIDALLAVLVFGAACASAGLMTGLANLNEPQARDRSIERSRPLG